MPRLKECERSSIEWREVEIELRDKRKVNSAYIMMLIMKRHSAKTKDTRKHLYPVHVVKIDNSNTIYQVKNLATGNCPLCNKRTVFFFSTKTGILKVKKCTCGGKWVPQGKGKRLYVKKKKKEEV